ncbi:MAG: amino acid transporter [Dehalococcoidia bacterium]
MSANDVHDVMDALSHAGCKAWLDGGWAVDAALGEQTRDHDDLDLVVELDAIQAIETALAPLGYRMRDDERPIRVVLASEDGRRVDAHTVVFDEGGGGVQPQPNGGTFRYPPEGFAVFGKIGRRELPCLSVEVQLMCHMGYEPDEKDMQDMRLLAARFGLKLPSVYS